MSKVPPSQADPGRLAPAPEKGQGGGRKGTYGGAQASVSDDYVGGGDKR